MPRLPATCADREVPPGSCRELPPGTHLATPRGAYFHHGIYVGDGRVVHYGGLAHGMRAGPIETVSLEQFTQGRPLRVLFENSQFSSAEVVRRALSRIGENRYRILTNNCEHFCEWCVRGEHRSHQVDRWLSWLLCVFGARKPVQTFAKFFKNRAAVWPKLIASTIH